MPKFKVKLEISYEVIAPSEELVKAYINERTDIIATNAVAIIKNYKILQSARIFHKLLSAEEI